MPFLSYPPGSVEPVTTADAMLACRLDDALTPQVAGLITVARQQAEHLTGRQYRLQVLRESLADWPASSLLLPADRASSVTITYRSAGSPDTWTTLDAAFYRWASLGGRTVLQLASGQAWPELAGEDYPERVRIDVTSGPASAEEVPESVRQYILASIAGWMDSPASLADGRMQPNPLFERLLDAEKVYLPCA